MKFVVALLALSMVLVGCGDSEAPKGDGSMESMLKDAQNNAPKDSSGGGKREGLVKADANTPEATNK